MRSLYSRTAARSSREPKSQALRGPCIRKWLDCDARYPARNSNTIVVLEFEENNMSRRNGDKSRFGRQRKEQIHRREKIRELRGAAAKAGQPSPKPKVG